MSDHRCGPDCRVCEARAERRAERTFDSRSDEDYEIRRAERHYEAQLFGRDV